MCETETPEWAKCRDLSPEFPHVPTLTSAPRVRPGRAASAPAADPLLSPAVPAFRWCPPGAVSAAAPGVGGGGGGGGGVQAGGCPSGVSPLRPWRRAAGPRAGRLHRPSFCERRLPRAAWRAGPGHRASPGIASLPRRPPHAPPEPPDLPGQARGWGAGRGGAGLRA